MKRKLGINLIPKGQWYDNLRSRLSKEKWCDLRKDCYAKAGFVCEICGASGKDQGFGWAVECHEVWDFSKPPVQKLVRLIALCPLCHKCQHPGLAGIKGESEIIRSHYQKVNNISGDEARNDFGNAFAEWRERNKINWQLNLDALIELSAEEK